MKMFDVVIKNGNVVLENVVEMVDIGIKSGKIVEIAKEIDCNNATVVIDAADLHVFPGLIDTHVHFNEPGRTEWEGFETGSKSLAAGGATTFFDMPLNSHPPTIDLDGYEQKDALGKRKSLIDYRLWGGLVPQNIERLEELHVAGVIGFKAFMSNSGIDDFQAADDKTLYAGMKKIAALDSILAVHAESDIITEELGKLVEKEDGHSFSASRPIYSELEAVNRILSFAEATKCKVHIVHISSSEVLEPIIAAKKRGVDVSVETCPHYLSLTVDDLDKLGAVAKCAPPLRTGQEVEGLWQAIKAKAIDIIGSDHSPSLESMKKGRLSDAWGGISGCQSTLSVLLEEGYWKREVDLSIIASLTSSNPAKRFGLYPQKGKTEVGSDADFCLVDLKREYTLKKDDLFYRNKQSPYIEKTFRGKVTRTILQGRTVYEELV
ncbi:allantoinase [Bacillales bacterium AN1005]|uniref:allantoinase n=1 Tax=Niallia taxi TaxID=2499688 RepID=UPI0021A5E019|nr:allantoinase [Niallia taxi]MCT2343914.1 allantoinase [Niallia taxi]MED3963693.1 allantoinase [Niallia taxi]